MLKLQSPPIAIASKDLLHPTAARNGFCFLTDEPAVPIFIEGEHWKFTTQCRFDLKTSGGSGKGRRLRTVKSIAEVQKDFESTKQLRQRRTS
jgi:hypothetical protein